MNWITDSRGHLSARLWVHALEVLRSGAITLAFGLLFQFYSWKSRKIDGGLSESSGQVLSAGRNLRNFVEGRSNRKRALSSALFRRAEIR